MTRGGALLFLFAALAASCRATRPDGDPTAGGLLPTSEEHSSASGAVEVVAFVDPHAPTRRLNPDEEYVAPRPSQQNALPAYPAEMLGARLPPQRVGVRFTITSLGEVRDVMESTVARTSEQADPRIVQLVHETVRKWCFSPPAVRRFRMGRDDDRDGVPDDRALDREDRISVLYDLLFTFELVDGRGVVRAEGER